VAGGSHRKTAPWLIVGGQVTVTSQWGRKLIEEEPAFWHDEPSELGHGNTPLGLDTAPSGPENAERAFPGFPGSTRRPGIRTAGFGHSLSWRPS